MPFGHVRRSGSHQRVRGLASASVSNNMSMIGDGSINARRALLVGLRTAPEGEPERSRDRESWPSGSELKGLRMKQVAQRNAVMIRSIYAALVRRLGRRRSSIARRRGCGGECAALSPASSRCVLGADEGVAR